MKCSILQLKEREDYYFVEILANGAYYDFPCNKKELIDKFWSNYLDDNEEKTLEIAKEICERCLKYNHVEIDEIEVIDF